MTIANKASMFIQQALHMLPMEQTSLSRDL